MSSGFLPRDRARHPPALAPDYNSSRLRSPVYKPLVLPQGPAELTGPVFGDDVFGPLDGDLLRNFSAPGETALGPRLIVHGRVRDETGRGVPNTLIELWQANAGGRYRHPNERYDAPLDPNFGGCGRVVTDAEGNYEFTTIRPGAYPWPNGPNTWRPAHIHFSLFGHAFAQRLITQMYFEGDPLVPLCAICQSVPTPEALDALIARQDMEATRPMDAIAYRFDIVLRGRDQTPFENRLEGA